MTADQHRAPKSVLSPYKDLPDTQFWRRAVSSPAPLDVDPVTHVPFTISKTDRVATAGSCFAQHIARTLVTQGFNYLVTEPGPADAGYGVFPARFGNIYTTRQLLQLFELAYGLRSADPIWLRNDGKFVDCFRPLIDDGGFSNSEQLLADRRIHLASVRKMFERCDVFIFTLGLTEGWTSKKTGLAVPLPPGVTAIPVKEDEFAFVNFSVLEMTTDLNDFIQKLRIVNPSVRVILTVSPVPLIATYESRHVLVSTIYSKSALRVVAEEITRSVRDVAYFPSYEVITGPHHAYRFFEPDLRSVSNSGVDHVMAIFTRHYLKDRAPSSPRARADVSPHPAASTENNELYEIICDEEALAQ